jgi:molecular chaperone HtpG
MFGNEETLVLNKNNDLIKKIIDIKDNDDRKNEVKLICEHIYDLAMMSNKQLVQKQ